MITSPSTMKFIYNVLAMATKLAPSHANLVMGFLETRLYDNLGVFLTAQQNEYFSLKLDPFSR